MFWWAGRSGSAQLIENQEESGSLQCPARLGGQIGFELDRTASNLIELVHPKKRRTHRQNTMIYEEWSKSIEL